MMFFFPNFYCHHFWPKCISHFGNNALHSIFQGSKHSENINKLLEVLKYLETSDEKYFDQHIFLQNSTKHTHKTHSKL